MNEQEKFLNELGNDQTKTVDVLEQPLDSKESPITNPEKEEEEAKVVPEDKDDDNDDFKPRNRRERRLLKKVEEEKNASIFLAGKLEALNEGKRAVSEETDYLKSVEKIYGTETPEAQLATDILKKALVGARDDARNQALAEMQFAEQRRRQEAAAASKELDNIIDDIQDNHDVTLSEVQQKGFFQLMYKMSPKDQSGSVIAYADPDAVWEIFSERIQKKGTDNRAKNLSARSMVQSGASKESTLPDDTQARYLREIGII